MLLRQTQEALADLSANSNLGLGDHLQDYVKAGVAGMPIGETEYDPALHDPSDIVMDSILTATTGQAYVEQVIPVKPLNVQVVTDLTTRAGSEHSGITEAKQAVASALQGAINGSVPSPADQVFSYRYVDGSESASEEVLTSTRQIIEVCRNGLTFVISDFNRLADELLLQAGPGQLNKAVAVKVNQQIGIEIPRNVGILPISGSLEINTADTEQVDRANKLLAAHHQRIAAKLQTLGMPIAQVVALRRSVTGFDSRATDTVIAQAVKSLR